jgi:hypothetical protein
MEEMANPSFPELPLLWSRRPSATEPAPPAPAPAQVPTAEVTTPPLAGRPEVVVRTSTRRRKTATAYWEDGRIVVVLPAHVRKADRPELIEWLVARVLAQRPAATASDEELATRAATLADRYVGGERPSSIRWVTNQHKRWGSCTSATREIRLSHRLRSVPEWVLDATIVHELAHLVHPDHSSAFHAIADRHPRQREAAIYLEGYSLGLGSCEG